ncbi:UNVERIFIED_CONTAM: hypothetical protein GTU68_008323 [Idotea baltica]|nr:hypothetical protein [Idotea baltica]
MVNIITQKNNKKQTN